jgi:hypothetical protein
MAGTWQALTHPPTFNTSTMIQLSDGRIMVQEEATQHWHALAPDHTGSYVDGTWSPVADMSFWRRYYASGMLKDGRIVVIGGEQSGAGGDTNRGEIYDPVADTWSPIPSPPGWAQVGDATCCVLPNGCLMIGALVTPDCIIYDPVANDWTPAASKAVRSNEETWVLLADDTIVTVQCFAPYRTERYSTSSSAWKDEGPLPVNVVDQVMHEIGPAMLMYNGQVIYFGAADVGGDGTTVIYTPPPTYTGTGTWLQGPNIPKVAGKTIVCNDCPASLLPNGKVLAACAPFLVNNWGSPIYFIEYEPFTNTISHAPTPPNNGAQLYWSRFMLTPTGQVLFSPSSSDVQCYTPDGGPQDAWRPVISSIEHQPEKAEYLITGRQLNGLSQANSYGDDCNSATNYPLVRLRDVHTGEVQFARTHDFGTRGITAGVPQSVKFSAAHIPHGRYELCVIANGISSERVEFAHDHRHREHGAANEECGSPSCCGAPKCGLGCGCRDTDATVEPELVHVRHELRNLSRHVDRLSAQIEIDKPHRERKESGKDDEEEDGRGRAATKGKRQSGRRGSVG